MSCPIRISCTQLATMSFPQERAAPSALRPNKKERAKIAKETINVFIPKLMSSNNRAREGVDSTELIYFAGRARGTLHQYFRPKVAGEYGQPKVSSSDPITSTSNASHPLQMSSPAIPQTATTSVSPKITVMKSDTLDAALAVRNSLPPHLRGITRIGVLNMASFLGPGGGVLNGAMAQEESLCVRSTLYPALKHSFYRLPRHSGLFTRDVLVCRHFIVLDFAPSGMNLNGNCTKNILSKGKLQIWTNLMSRYRFLEIQK